MDIPKLIFIVPYRDREQHQLFFSKHMKTILEDLDSNEYKIYYIHQCDSRLFNRGAMKNIGFLIIKQLFPNNYRDITIVFNDVDTMPYTKNFLNYNTIAGNVKHFYGYDYTLGGIVSINGGDFEKIMGFPNLWNWGFEDNILQERVISNGLTIDRTNFYPIMDKNILQLNDGVIRIINRDEHKLYVNKTADTYNEITSLQYEINEQTGFIDVTSFETIHKPTNNNINHNIQTDGNQINFGRKSPKIKMMF
jgi:hypothetical protein